jgi:hypothetical protein
MLKNKKPPTPWLFYPYYCNKKRHSKRNRPTTVSHKKTIEIDIQRLQLKDKIPYKSTDV